MNTSFFGELLNTISDRGRQLLDLSGIRPGSDETVETLSMALLSGRGEASGVAIAFQILSLYKGLSPEQRSAYFDFLATEFSPDTTNLAEAARAYLSAPGDKKIKKLPSTQYVLRQPKLQQFYFINFGNNYLYIYI